MTRKANVPQTSRDAFHNLDPVKLSQTHQDIVRALKAIGSGNFEQVADFLMVKPEKIWRRMSEVERAGAIYKPGHTVLTKNGAKSYVYKAVPETGETPQPVTLNKKIEGATISDFSKKLIQQNLFSNE
jgi:DNA-binding Lrp family transcriptional regulator